MTRPKSDDLTVNMSDIYIKHAQHVLEGWNTYLRILFKKGYEGHLGFVIDQKVWQ